MPITPLPTPPSRQNPATFADDADEFLGALPTFQTEANALESNVNAKEASAVSASTTAVSASSTAVASANNKGAWSALTGALSIPASVNHNDGVWVLNANLADVALSEPTDINTDWTEVVSYTNPTFQGSITEETYELVGTVLDPANGTIQYKTLAAATTFTETLTTGQSVILRIAGGDAHIVTWPTTTWVTGTAPTLTANDVIVLWKEQTVLYGSYVGSVVTGA